MAQVLRRVQQTPDERIIVGFRTGDDASIVRTGEDRALVSSVDLFTPIVDDPYTYGQIAAANALSDIFAMGARPITGLSILCYDPKLFGPDVPAAILQGALDKAAEAQVVIAGGHTVKSAETLFGLSVTGEIDPARLLRNNTAAPGDLLYLTKPLGTGILSTALKRSLLPAELEAEMIKWMTRLNGPASAAGMAAGATACTDVTGFGFLGHLLEMTTGAMSVRVRSEAVPILAGVDAFARDDVLPGGTRSNLLYVNDDVCFAGSIPDHVRFILADAQTSGGLLLAIPPAARDVFLENIDRKGGIADEIGEFVDASGSRIMVE